MLETMFAGTRVYFSGSIKGAKERDPAFAWNLVQYMKFHGAEVLSEHVAARNQEEMDEIRARRTGRTVREMLAHPNRCADIRQNDIDWLDEATHLVALVNAPSLGVGMEIERAIHKPARGLNETPILALAHVDTIESLSCMVRGITPHETSFQLRPYRSLDQAEGHIQFFLRS